MKNQVRLLCALASVMAFAASVAADDPPLQTAQKAMFGGEPQQAVNVLRAAVQKQPRDGRLQAELAEALLAIGAVDDALKAAQAAKAAAPAMPAASRAVALVQAVRYETDAALKTLDEALARNRHNGALLAAKGRVLWQLKRTKSAIEALQQAARDKDTAAEAQRGLGIIYYFRGWQSEGAFPGWHEEPEFRQPAQDAFKAAIAARPAWYQPHIALGDTFMMAEQPSEALAEFDAAIKLAPNAGGAHLSRWRALKVLGRVDDIKPEVAAAATSNDVRLVSAARQAYALIGQSSDAHALAARLERQFPTSAGAQAVLAERIEAARVAKQDPAVIEQAQAFAQKFPYSTRLASVYDALLEAFQATPATPAETIAAAVDARIRYQPDPAPYLLGANMLVARNARLDKAIALAEASIKASEVFINENLGSYKMSGKVQGALARSRSAALDLVGWASFQKKDLATATATLEEAERLSRGQDFVNQVHLGELARAKGDLARARESYLRALTLQGGAPPVREAARKSLADVYATLGNQPAEFDGYLAGELDRRRKERQSELLRSMVDKPLPDIKLTDLKGQPVDVAALRGQVLLLNFFSSW
jgi:Flp pilus assembly protein TadD